MSRTEQHEIVNQYYLGEFQFSVSISPKLVGLSRKHKRCHFLPLKLSIWQRYFWPAKIAKGSVQSGSLIHCYAVTFKTMYGWPVDHFPHNCLSLCKSELLLRW